MTKQKGESQRLVQLDILRGIAILLVMGCHYAQDVHYSGPPWLRPLNDLFYRSGWMGVDLFFVLSGFLVGGLLFRELRTQGSLDVPRFLVRRAFKIWPLYLVYLGIMVLSFAWFNRSLPYALRVWWPNLIHLQNYASWEPRPHTWSLAVEEHFYLLLPLLLALFTLPLRRAHRKTELPLNHIPFFSLLVGMVLVVCLLLRSFTYQRTQLPFAQAYMSVVAPTHLRIDSLFFGVLLAYWYHFFPQRLASVAHHTEVLLLLGLSLIAPMLFLAREDGPFVSVFGYSLLYLGFGAILLALVHIHPQVGIWGRVIRSLPARTLAAIGVFSYPIYLWHHDLANVPVHWLAIHSPPNGLLAEARWFGLVGLYCLLAISGGVFWSLLLERPSLALRDRCFPAVAQPISIAAQVSSSRNPSPKTYAAHH